AARRFLVGERQTSAVGTPRGLEVIRGTGGERDRFAAVRGHLPDVSTHRERDPPAVPAPCGVERPRRQRRPHLSLPAVAVSVPVRTRTHHGRGDDDRDGEEKGDMFHDGSVTKRASYTMIQR